MPRGRRICTGDGGVGGEGRRGVEDTGGSGEEETGRGRMEGARREPMLMIDEQMGEEMVDGVGHTATTRVDDGGEDGRKFKE